MSYDCIHRELHCILASLLKTSDTKEIGINCCLAYQKEYVELNKKKKLFASSFGDYERKEYFNESVELITLLKFDLQEYDEGIDYFLGNYIERDKEITIYCLLTYFLSLPELSNLWIREYEKAKQKGIKLRDSLKKEYAKLIQQQK